MANSKETQTQGKSNVPLYVLLVVIVVAIVYFAYSYGFGNTFAPTTSTAASTSAATSLSTAQTTYPTTIVNASTTTIPSPAGAGCIASSSTYVCENATYSSGNFSVVVGQYSGSNWQSVSVEFFLNSSANATSPKFNVNNEYTITGIVYSGTPVKVVLPVPAGSAHGQRITGYVWAQYRLFDTSPVQQAFLGPASYTT